MQVESDSIIYTRTKEKFGLKPASHWGNIEEALYDDIAHLKDKYTLNYDAVFFTGDLVNRGKEYTRLNTWLDNLNQHLSGIESHPLFLAVPGNHDLERPGETVTEVPGWYEKARIFLILDSGS